MEMEIPVYLIVAFAVLALFVLFYTQNIQATEQPKIPKSIVVTNNSGVDAIRIEKPDRVPGGWEWPLIEIGITAKYSADLKEGEQVDVVPFVIFNGREQKALFIERDVPREVPKEFFTLTKQQDMAAGTVRATSLVTKDGPVAYGVLDNENRLNVGDKLIFAAKGTVPNNNNEINFTLKLDGVDLSTLDAIKDISTLDIGRSCKGTFHVECYNRLYTLDLFGEQACEGTGLLNKCQAVIEMCNTTVTITNRKVSCSERWACVTFSTEPGRQFKVFETGEKPSVAFFKKKCADRYDQLGSLENLKLVCDRTEFLGQYKFTGDVIDKDRDTNC